MCWSIAPVVKLVETLALMVVIDTHCHPHLGVGGIHASPGVVASTHPGDWDRVRDYASGPVAARAYGVHPWWSHEATGDWVSALRARLASDPSSMCGELGLDGLRGGAPDGAADLAVQDAVFAQQLGIAAELGRPATIHCVRAFGRVREALDAAPALPPAIAMHSYGGSFDFARDLEASLRRRGTACFFGFSWFVNGRRKRDKQAALIRNLPDACVLLESDLEDGAAIDDNLNSVVDLVAHAKSWTHDDTRRICDRNAHAFLGSFLPPR